MPAGQYHDVEPVTDERIRACADLWSRVGKMTLDYGIKVLLPPRVLLYPSCRAVAQFYEWSDPRYVFWYCDTAQHMISEWTGRPLPEAARRCGGFHLKDTHHADLIGDYRQRRSPSYGQDHTALVLGNGHRGRPGRFSQSVRRDEVLRLRGLGQRRA